MNVEIGTEAALFPEKEYIMGIFFAVEEICRRSWDYINRSQTHEIGNWG
jgi:hypothetical protein